MKLVFFLLVACLILTVNAEAADILLEPAYSATMINSNSISVTGPFNIKANLVGLTKIERVEFYTDGVLTKIDWTAPYWYNGDTNGIANEGVAPYPGTHRVEARVISWGGSVAYTEIFTIVPGLINNYLRNPNFNPSLSYWGYHSANYVSWSSLGKAETGALHFTANSGGISESWQGRYELHPGDKVVYEGWFKAGPKGTTKYNNGVGLGFDIRQKNNQTIIYTVNGPATLNPGWTFLHVDYTIPCIGNMDKPISSWWVSSGNSSTGKGARAGLAPSGYNLNGKQMPYDLGVTVWVQIWHRDTVKSGDVDNLRMTIVPKAVTCASTN